MINRLSSEDLHKELTAYSMRVNRLTPYKPNPMVTLHQVAYQSRPVHLTYEYELNAMTSKQPVDFEAIAPMLQRRYCTDPEFELAAANRVPVTWEYLRRRAAAVQEHCLALRRIGLRRLGIAQCSFSVPEGLKYSQVFAHNGLIQS